MKIQGHQTAFVSALSLVQGIVEKNSIKPITANALLEAETFSSGDEIFISATNLQTGIRLKCSGIQVEKSGKISVNARKLFEIVKELPEKEICIEEKENYRVEISCGDDLLFTILGLPPEDFPFLMKEEESFEIWKKEIFLQMLQWTFFSISKDESKQNICGSHLENIENGCTRIVTTDGYRLSIIDEKPGNQLPLPEEGITIPTKAVYEIIRVINEKKDIKELKVCFSNKMILVYFGEIKFFVRLIEKKFPDYHVIVPGDIYERELILLEKNIIKPALKRISIISDENNSPVLFNFIKNELLIKTEDSDIGNAKEKIILKKEIKKEINFILNCSYVLDILSVSDDDFIIEYNFKEDKPIVLKPVRFKDKIKYIIMPMVI
jgi:DNA polymerase III subunit beta